MSSTPDDGYIKLWRKALHNGSSLMELTATQRWIFLAYAAAARWQEPYRGALCDEDGTPWSRTKRAEIAGVRYETAKAAEEEMIELDMAVLDGRGATGHHDSQGRFRIANYEDYQVVNRPRKLEAGPASETGGLASETGGKQPPKPEAGTFDNSASETGGTNGEEPVGNGAGSEPTFDKSASETGGSDSQEVVKKNYNDSLPPNLPPKTARDGVELFSFDDIEQIWSEQVAGHYKRLDLQPTKSRPQPRPLDEIKAECEETIETVYSDPPPSPQAVAACWQTASRKIKEGADPDSIFRAVDASLQAMVKRDGPNGSFQNFSSYFRKAVRDIVDEDRAAEAAQPVRQQFTRARGPNPRLSPAHDDQHRWEKHLSQFRKNPLWFFFIHEEYRDRGRELGYWPEDDEQGIEAALEWRREQNAAEERRAMGLA